MKFNHKVAQRFYTKEIILIFAFGKKNNCHRNTEALNLGYIFLCFCASVPQWQFNFPAGEIIFFVEYILPDQNGISFFLPQLPTVINSFGHPDISGSVLCFSIKLAIPTFIFFGG